MCQEQKGFTLWFTGSFCSGKTAIADRLAQVLKEKGLKVERLDGDVVRQSLKPRFRLFPPRSRRKYPAGDFCGQAADQKWCGYVLTSFISPYRR